MCRRDAPPLLAGVAVAVAGAGALLAVLDHDAPMRAPFGLFFLVAAPALGLAVALRRLQPGPRAVLAVGGAIAVDLLVAQGLLTLHMWSVSGAVVTVAALSAVPPLLSSVRRNPLS